jgi:hypothetical protein
MIKATQNGNITETFDSISMFTPGLVVLAIIISWIMSISGCSMLYTKTIPVKFIIR